MSNTTLTIVIPDLAPVLSQEMTANLLPKHLKQLLKKGKKEPHPATLARSLFQLFSDKPLQGTDLPTMAVCGAPKTLRITPCYVQADRDQLRLFGVDLEITASEADALISLLQPLFTESLTQDTPDKWRMPLADKPDITLTALATVNGQTLQIHLPKGNEANSWIALWNEVQMALHDCSVNQAREKAGKLPINSIWFWGLGEFTPANNRWQSVCGQAEYLVDLAASTKLTAQAIIPTINALAAGNHLLVLPTISLDENIETQLESLEKMIFEPIIRQLKWRKLSRVHFIFPEFASYELSFFTAWRSR